MNLICYLPAALAANHPIRRLVSHGLPHFTRQVYESLTGLERQLTCPGQSDAILVLVACDRQDLERMVAMGDLCQAHPLVLILPAEDDDLERLGHRLRPRFMTCQDNSVAEMESVLARLGDRRQPPAAEGQDHGPLAAAQDGGAMPAERTHGIVA